MGNRLSHYQTSSLQEVVEIGGDLLLLPEQRALPYEEVRAIRHGQTVAVGESLLTEAVENIFRLSDAYRSYRGLHGTEPGWMQEKPMSVQSKLRLDYAFMDEEALAILGVFPHTGLSYMIREGGLIEKLEQALGLRRLQGVMQLGYLQAPWFADSLYDHRVGEHNRLVHSYDVMTIASVIGYNLGLEESKLNTLRMAAFSHDMGTPAGGDSVKFIDPEAFDEDMNYPQLLAGHDWSHIKAEFRINEEELCQAILNKGVLGQILDIADKLAYVARDLHACRPFLEYGRKHMDQYGLHSLFALIDRHPTICGLWDAVELSGEQVVITDTARLAAFLKARTLMFRELYYHPNARFGEYLISRVLVKALYDKGSLTREVLLSMGDRDLNATLEAEYGTRGKYWYGSTLVEEISDGNVARRTFTSRDEADSFLRSLREQGNPFALVEDNSRAIKTGVHFLVKGEEGPVPFSQECPGEAKEIEEMAQLFPSIHVYYLLREPVIPRARLAELAEAFYASTAP